MLKWIPIIVVSIAYLSGCKKCVECEVRLKQSQDIIGQVDKFCGTDKKIEEEENRLRTEFTCIECSVNTGLGTAQSGVHCGNRAFTDSIQAEWDAGAAQIGASAQCVYYRDTANVTCVLN